MSIFKLPDLGEGLPDAEVREWFVAEGDTVELDQPLCSMETAKALVDVPSPIAGKIVKLHGKPGDIIQTGAPLVTFESDGAEADALKTQAAQDYQEMTGETETTTELVDEGDAGTVVGAIEVGSQVVHESATGIRAKGASADGGGKKVKATLKVRKLAKQLGVELSSLSGTGPGGSISAEDVQQAASGSAGGARGGASVAAGFEQLHGPERGMAFAMARSHEEIADVTIFEDADIDHFGKGDNITLRIIRAVSYAAKKEPKLNAHYDGKNHARKLFDEINLAVGVDTPGGLYAPVIRDIDNKSDDDLRNEIKSFKTHAEAQDFPPEMLHDATFTLSNFGVFTGRYANPMIMPPTVAILGVGKVRQAVIPVNNEPAVHRIVPLSLTVDHRVVTGGEAARFLAAMIEDLSR